ncbi:MAG: RNA-binding protein [Fusobacteriaceae bacterium]
MTKNNFLKNFPNEDEFLLASLFDEIELCRDIEYVVYSSYFLPPSIWKTLESIQEYLKIRVLTCGLNEFSERKVVAFYPQDGEEWELFFPIKYFEIHGKNRFRELKHKDFLGTLMSLGVKREVMGDLIVSENFCYGVILEDFFQIICDQVKSVATIPVTITEANSSQIPEPQFSEINDTVQSLRLDTIISSALNCSRSISENLIESGDVSVDYQIEKKTSKIISPQTVITVKKKGKFIFSKDLGENKKGKIRIQIKKYI